MDDELTEEERMKNLEQIMVFMDSNFELKQIFRDLAPKDIDVYKNDAIIEYFDKQYDKVQDIEFLFSKMIQSVFDFRYLENVIKPKVQEIKNNMLNSVEYSEKGVKESHQTYVSGMSQELLEKVKNKFVGYTGIYSSFVDMMKDVKSFNELLHVMHSYVTNNKDILESMPIVARKKNECDTFTLFGKETEEAKKIFDSIDPEKTKAGTTQILALDNRILMMIRDLGHALTLDIDTSQEKPLVNYFIPKVTNRKIVSQLRGVYNFNELQDNNAVGMFQIEDANNIAEEVMNFVEKVPDDSAMFIEGGILCENNSLDETEFVLVEQPELDVEFKTVSQDESTSLNSNNQNNEAKWLDTLEGFYEETSNVRNLPKNDFSKIMNNIQKDKKDKNDKEITVQK